MQPYICALLSLYLVGIVVAEDGIKGKQESFDSAIDYESTIYSSNTETAPSTAIKLQVFYSIDGSKPVRRGDLVLDPYSPKRSSNRMESSTAVDSAVTAVKPKGSRYEIQIGDASNQKILKASVPLCMLQTSRFHEMITVHVDSHGKPFHLDYLVNANECLPDIDFGKTLHFKTVVAVGRLADAPRPILEKLKETVDGQEPVPEQSFIQKYWQVLMF